jgi:hypothetical protein
MRIVAKRAVGFVCGLTLLMLWSPRVSAWYPYPFWYGRPWWWSRPPVVYYPMYNFYYGGYPGGYGGGYPQGYGGSMYGGDPYAGSLQGSAAVIDAQSKYLVATQQAYLLKEQVRKAQIDNSRKAFDEWLYERANTPTLNEQRERERREEVRRDLNDPPLTEIWSGRVLNVILSDLQDWAGRGVQGPAIPLEADLLAKINVYPAKGPSNVGLLKEKTLAWPLSLRVLPPALETKPLRDRIDKLLPEAKEQAVKGRVKADLLAELTDNIARLRKYFARRMEDMTFSQYAEGKRFLSDLEASVRALEQADAADYLNGKYVARGRTVAELVQHMKENGLRFGAASSGDEAAYNALYQALATYGREVIAKVAAK